MSGSPASNVFSGVGRLSCRSGYRRGSSQWPFLSVTATSSWSSVPPSGDGEATPTAKIRRSSHPFPRLFFDQTRSWADASHPNNPSPELALSHLLTRPPQRYSGGSVYTTQDRELGAIVVRGCSGVTNCVTKSAKRPIFSWS
ncbi:hypothetical protein MES5069_310064 [Mesorhizobium escarrei]|uniref:Uncharacterized protein n=1 Tax=Mesorhizobium escarrei TaxID=666018 RepID=A0ABM9DZV0_9HYPH|nr:hypothetical protein MES5069_310064 [Mesorhizobium escarrei]